MVNHLLETRHPLSSYALRLCVSVADSSSILRTLFQVRYAATPLLATLTTTPRGDIPPILGRADARTRERFDAPLYSQTTIFRELRSMMPVVRRGGNAHAAKFILVILLVEDVPLLAAFDDFFFLRSDFLAHFQFDFLFVFQRSRQNLHHLLANSVAVVDKFDFLAVHQHVRD